MGWSLDYLKLKEPELLDEFFLAIGKALYLATAFEGKCQWVIRVVKLTEHFEQSGDISAVRALATAMKDKLLGPTLADMKEFPDFSADDVALLERAKDARNFIAHESADIGPLSGASAEHIFEQLERLRNEVEALTAGDNLISRWVYGIENREPAPPGIQENYPRWVQQWIFGAVGRT
jgi:hypothetical protein